MNENDLKAYELEDEDLDEIVGGFDLFAFLRGGKKNGAVCQKCGAPLESGAGGRARFCSACLERTKVSL